MLTGPIAAALLSRVANTFTVPLAPDDRPDWTPVAIRMLTARDGDRQHALPMFAAAPGPLLRHPRVAILLATYGGTPTLDEAVLEWMDGRCSYRSAPGAVLENNQTLDLIKDPGCRADEKAPANLRFTVRVKERNERVAVWTYQPPPGVQSPELIRVSEGDPGPQRAGIVRGTYVEEGGRPQRIALLNYVWNIAADPTWIWVTLVVAAALTLLSVLLLTGATGANPGDRKNVARGALACASLAFALGILYATFVPPLQAPDEPDHLLSFATANARATMTAGAESLARRGHLQRLQFHGDQRFRPSDVGHPWPIAWTSDVFAQEVEGRSLTTFWWWKTTGGLTRGLTTARTLLAARLANALLFAITIGVAALLFASAAPAGGTRVRLPMVLLLIPTLPFFATHLSEFALLTDAYVLLAASVCVLLADGPTVHRIGFPLGASMALALMSGRSAAPILPLWAGALAARILVGQREGTARSAAIFWASCATGLALFPAFVSEAFSGGVWTGAMAPEAAPWFRVLAGLLRTYPWLLLAPVPLGYAFERLVRRVPSAIASRWAPGVARAVGYALIAAVALSLVGSLLFQFPTLATRETAGPATVAEYAKQVLLVGLTSLRLVGPDLLLSTSFWGGFGWIDTVLPPGLIVVLTTSLGGGLILTGWSIARRRDSRQAALTVILGVSATAALAAYAVSTYFLNRNLHGRYLVGLYVATVLGAWTVPFPDDRGSRLLLRFMLIAAVVAIHAYALPFVLLRYF